MLPHFVETTKSEFRRKNLRDGWPIQARFWLEWASSPGFADQKMNVLRHHDVSVDAKAEAAAHALKGVLKHLSAHVVREQGTAVITTKKLRNGFARFADNA